MILARAAFILRVCTRNLFRSEYTFSDGSRERISGPMRLRCTFEELGGVFFKFGQILAMRFDILPMHYAVALFDLFDNATFVPNERMFEVFRSEIGRDITDYFTIDPKPIGSASFAQVYRGTYLGQPIIVKLQKPGVARHVKTDIALLRGLMWLIQPLQLLRIVRFEEIIRQLEEWLEDELDYRREAANGTIIHTHIQNQHLQDHIVVPKIYPEFTRPRVLVESFVPGVTVNQLIKQSIAHGTHLHSSIAYDPDKVGTAFVRDLMRQYFIDHFFQADPHPGNLMVLPGNVIAFIDFGIIGRPASEIHHFCEFVYGAVTLDTKRATRSMVQFAATRLRRELGSLGKDTEAQKVLSVILAFLEEKLVERFEPIMQEWHATTGDASLDLGKRSSALAFFKIVRILEEYGLRLPPDVIAFIRTLLIIDMVCLRLAPEFNMVKAARAFFDDFPISSITDRGFEHQMELRKLEEIESLKLTPEQERAREWRKKEREALAKERLTDKVHNLVNRYPELYARIKAI